MSHRFVAFTSLLGIALAAVWLAPAPVAAQRPAAAAPAAKTAAPAKWTVRRLSDGQPDLQGYWTNSTYTPLQRPKEVTKEFYTREEALESMKRAAQEEAELTEPGTIEDVHYDFTQFGLDKSQSPMALNLRTSLIVDPPDGRIPPMTAEGQKRAAERAAARKRAGAATDAAQNQSLQVRCILMDRAGPPMLGQLYQNNYQIVQAPGYVMILVEMIHDARIIPVGGLEPLPSNVRQWMGSSRGRWEGETLVIETTNFTDKTAFQGSSPNMRLTERITRVAEDELRYQFTVDDPATWARPWSAEVLWKQGEGPIFEHACHEGNYGLYNTLAGARAEEKAAAAKKPSN
jgi:hypothetical protein